jgi:D-glycero-D-manno-heptose 1,7-bisphosphate phosphatase
VSLDYVTHRVKTFYFLYNKIERRRNMQRALFVDKDDMLIPGISSNFNSDTVSMNPQVGKTLRHLQNLGYLLVVTTNQTRVVKGLLSETALKKVERCLKKLLSDSGIEMHGFYYCAHKLGGEVKKYTLRCSCNKPQPGLLLQAAKDLNIDLTQSWTIGDRLQDIESGKRAGCCTIWYKKENSEVILGPHHFPDYIAQDWRDVCDVISQRELKRKKEKFSQRPFASFFGQIKKEEESYVG